jgi:hypothetical protein
VLGTLSAAEAAVHVAYLGAIVLAGWIACRITFARRLLP